MRLYKLDETAIHLKGRAAHFLNGLTSNALDQPFNAFLNPHGRIIATFRQKRISDDEFLIGVPSLVVEELLKHVDRYARLNHTAIQTAPDNVYMDLDSGEVLWSAEERPNDVSTEVFTIFRLEHELPCLGIDYQAGEFILNVHEHRYVSYTKGCFLGQEPVAKVHNRSRPVRKLMVRFADQCSPPEAAQLTSQAQDPATGRVKGFVFVPNTAV